MYRRARKDDGGGRRGYDAPAQSPDSRAASSGIGLTAFPDQDHPSLIAWEQSKDRKFPLTEIVLILTLNLNASFEGKSSDAKAFDRVSDWCGSTDFRYRRRQECAGANARHGYDARLPGDRPSGRLQRVPCASARLGRGPVLRPGRENSGRARRVRRRSPLRLLPVSTRPGDLAALPRRISGRPPGRPFLCPRIPTPRCTPLPGCACELYLSGS